MYETGLKPILEPIVIPEEVRLFKTYIMITRHDKTMEKRRRKTAKTWSKTSVKREGSEVFDVYSVSKSLWIAR